MITRNCLPAIISELETPKILLLVGARQTGKTSLLLQLSSHLKSKNNTNVHMFTLEDPTYLATLNEHPQNLFKIIPSNQKAYVLIDEVQYLDNPSNFLKYIYDLHSSQVKLIVTGSSAFYIDQKFTDSLAGRKRIFHIMPFQFSEFLAAKNEPELRNKLNNAAKPPYEKQQWLLPEKQQLTQYLGEYLRYGAYPEAVLADSVEKKESILKELRDSFLQKDFFESGIQYHDKAYQLLKIISGQIGQLLNTQELANTLDVSHDTIRHYLYILQKSFVIKLCRPFSGNLRKELTKMPKAYFLDIGFRNMVLGNMEPIESRLDRGEVLENTTYISLLHQHHVATIQFWRTQNKHEIDFILNQETAIETKFQEKQFNPKHYQLFTDTYPNIPLYSLSYLSNESLDLLDILS